MTGDLQLRKAVVAVIVAALTAAVVFSIVGWYVPAGVIGGLAAVLALELATTSLQGRRRTQLNEALAEKASQHAESGRKLVIYERETGLFAHWYIALRCEEECYRAKRYEHEMTVVAIAPAPGIDDPWAVQDYTANWLRRQLRKADLAAYVGNGAYVVLMPQCDTTVAHNVVDRLRTEIEGVEVGVSSYPTDGSDFDELLAAAQRRLGQPVESVA